MKRRGMVGQRATGGGRWKAGRRWVGERSGEEDRGAVNGVAVCPCSVQRL